MRLLGTAAGRGILVLLFAFVLAALLDAEGLRKQAQIQPQGFERRVALAATRPLVHVSRALHLTSPRHELQVAIGRAGEDRIDARVHLTLPPPAGPLPRPAPRQPRRPAKPLFTRAHPLRVWVAGDSLAQVPGDALERLGGAVDVVGVESRLATGLARPDLYNWYTRFNQLLAGQRPQVAVLSFGADDAHDYLAGVPGGRQVGPLGSRVVGGRVQTTGRGGDPRAERRRRQDVWLGLPIPDGPGFRHSFPIVNAIIAAVARLNPSRSTYVDTWHLLDSARGTYTPYLRVHGTLTLMRLPDGVHYTPAAGDLIAQRVLAVLRRSYLLR